MKMSMEDKLTGVWNKATIEQNCTAYLREKADEQCALIVMDIDNFKGVNDTLGHHVGDEILTLVGESIRKVFRESDIYGRIGGDEFAILMKNVISRELVEMKMGTLVSMIEQGAFENNHMTITCSYGAILKDHDETMEYVPLFTMADNLLYCSKESGKNQGYMLSITEYEELGATEVITRQRLQA